MKTLSVILLLIISGYISLSQTSDTLQKRKLHAGLGVGLDYGGFGGRLSYAPTSYLGFFGGVGYILVGVGYNAGVSLKLFSEYRCTFTYSVMYGYNGFIKVQGADEFNKIYYGVSTGPGVEIWNRARTNYFDFKMLYPFRPDEFDRDENKIKANPNIKTTVDPWDILFSFGYHWGLDLKNYHPDFNSLPHD